MKNLVKIAGLCLASVLVMGMAITATASAAPHWLQCRENAGTGTKWTESKCSTAGSAGKWEWVELKTTEKVATEGTLRLTDKKGGLLGEKVVVECSGTDTGTIGPGKSDQTITVTTVSCRNIENCPGNIKAEARNLPWQTELFETEGKIRDAVVSEIAGKSPGWKVECTGISDICEGNTTTAMNNIQATGIVHSVFDAKSAKVNCSRGGAGQGEVIGTVLIRSEAGWAIQVS